MENLTDRTARAVRWRFAGTVAGALLQFAVGVILSRLLRPADFGTVALAAVVLGMLKPLSDFGVGAALVQKADVAERHVRAAFTFSLLAGVALAALVAVMAPLLAVLLRDPQVTPILRVLSAALALRGIGVAAEALLARRLEFKQLFLIETGTALVGYGGIAAALAVSGYGAWSLVWGGVVQTVLASAVHLMVVRHSVRPLFDVRALRELLGFGVGASLAGWVNYLALHGDNFVVGRWIGAPALGLYSRAYSLMNVPFTFASGVMSGVLFPAFAHVQEQPARLQRGFLMATELTALVAAPAMAALVVAAPHLVPALYGAEWSGVVAPLQILCAAGYFRALYHLGGIVIRSVGRPYAELLLQIAYAVMVIGGSLLAARKGLPWVAAAVAAAIVYMFVATAALALKATGTSWAVYFRAQRGALATGAITGGVALAARAALDASRASDPTIAIAVLAAASLPWGFGVMLNLRRPELERIRTQLTLRPLRSIAGH